MKKTRQILFVVICCCISLCNIKAQQEKSDEFSFVFMTDIHLEPGLGAIDGFQMAIDTANKLNADFVLTGGDLISDALAANQGRADSLYTLYGETIKKFEVPVYNTIGNHELFGIYRESGVDSTHPDYNDGMYKKYLGDTYYSFDHKGWHFIVLNSIADGGNSNYIGFVDDEQIEWLKNDLEQIDTTTPIVLSTHIPFVTTFNQFRKGSLAPNDEGLVVSNSMQILTMLYKYNIKLVLQGHLHIIEYINVQNKIQFLVGGAVSARWWKGPNLGMEEGFMLISIKGEEISWDYIDYGWEAINMNSYEKE
ncbi:3',5'-cyclic adenosine monophosphate phosphodiesterase CpdA [subsurface metagenome]